MNSPPRHVVIIGNGITGVSTALRLRERLPDCRITMISGESTYPWSRPALMYVFMGHMRYQDTKPWEDRTWREKRIDLVRDWVVEIEAGERRVVLHRNAPIEYDELVLALGSKPNKFGWPGQDLDGVQGMYDLMDLERLYRTCERTKTAVVVGGGLIGIELGEMLHSRGIHVDFLVREPSYWSNVLPAEESRMVNRIIEREGFGLHLETNLKAIVDDGGGRVGGVETAEGPRFECQLVGLTAGVSANIDLVKGSSIETGRGVLVDDGFRTSAPHVWAAGDCAEIRARDGGRNLIQQVWYTGKRQGALLADALAGDDVHYDPGIWYNSAKFLHLEYQTYGDVNRNVPGEQSLYWEHDDGLHALRLVHVEGRVIGVNLMGIRYRHRKCEEWIRDRRSVEWVLEHLDEGNFDPEFAPRHEARIRRTLLEAAR